MTAKKTAARSSSSRPKARVKGQRAPRPAHTSVHPTRPAPGLPTTRTSAAQNRVKHAIAQEFHDAPRGAIRVVATRSGYYGDERRREGDVFSIKSEQEFSKVWMRKVAKSTPGKKTGPNEVIRKRHDEILGARHGGGQHVDDDNGEGVEDTGDNPLDAD